ncbi:hypothetical protein EDD29_7739 [Actinocorallia herbida]|uniref:ATPase AAA-type core domain-containing protein n=1 Tax=Actinocorallia herbida TaxID=58109 RepID=A0A3N1D960_9ACTN|nr:ATP-binding protein [Actinocorallia herbida]ROO90026.1 hypothetical protein EDD29_7739 [Actinocorallia herbida]
MLIRFEASNHRSIREPAELSMVAIDHDRAEARHAPMLGESLLPVAAIYGPNASGKSNVISALAWLCDAVRNSVYAWEEEIPVEPFIFRNGRAIPSEFTAEITINDIRFEYILEVDSEHVIYEGLFHYPEKKRRRIFEREGPELKLQRGLGAISGTRGLMTDRTLALSVAKRFDEPLVRRFAQELQEVQILGSAGNVLGSPFSAKGYRTPRLMARNRSISPTARWFDNPPDQLALFEESEISETSSTDRDQALAMLRLADLGIEDVVIDTDELRRSDGERVTRRKIRLLHKSTDESVPFDLEIESEGTRSWFNTIGPVLSALRRGSIVLFDELDASLHPTLSAELLKIFHSPATNPRAAQLIFTSHDTSLLNHLNRDEVWLTEKKADGSTRLGALSDFAGERVRRSQNLENAYLHGRFGALPQVDQTLLLRALGLIG